MNYLTQEEKAKIIEGYCKT